MVIAAPSRRHRRGRRAAASAVSSPGGGKRPAGVSRWVNPAGLSYSVGAAYADELG
jgi:hypothetical protein